MSQEFGRVANFSAGPAQLPLEVLKEVQTDLLNYKGSGQSVLEMSHRSKVFMDIFNKAEADLRELLNIPKNYHVLFVQGGATLQFSAVPLNLNLPNSDKPADYIITGNWSKKATEEAQRMGKVNVVYDAMKQSPTCSSIPDVSDWKLSEDAAYLHVCINETVHGVSINPDNLPKVSCPIVADWSSSFMSAPIDVSKFGVIYAGAQKNIGPAGCTVVIVRDDLCNISYQYTPLYVKWYTHVKKAVYNTPPCFTIYVMGLVFQWMKAYGGLSKIYERNVRKAKVVYDVIDQDDFYIGAVAKKDRSLMNIRFNISAGKELEAKFLEEGLKRGFVNMKGYRTLGGIRVSTYNAQPEENCRRVARFMAEFREKYQHNN